LAVAADVSREEGAQKVVDQAITTFGSIDILVNNVGTARGGGLIETTDELWADAIDDAHDGGPHVAADRAAHAAPWGWVDCHHRVDLRTRGRRANDIQ